MNSIFNKLLSVILLFASTHSFSQNKDLSLLFNHTANGQPMEVGKTIFAIPNGKMVLITRAEFYLSKFKVINKTSDTIHFDDTYALVDARYPLATFPIGSFSDDFDFRFLNMGIGVDVSKNHSDPTLYPSSHPLSFQDPSMHWGWSGGYRFLVVEGLVDNDGDGIPEQEFQFHNLGDQLYFRTLLDMTGFQQVDSNPLVINLDYTKLFINMSMIGSLTQHGSAEINKTMLTNASKGKFFAPAITSAVVDVDKNNYWTLSQNENLIIVDMDPSVELYSVNVYDGSGRSTYRNNNVSADLEINKTAFDFGVYFVSIQSDGIRTSTKKIVITKP